MNFKAVALKMVRADLPAAGWHEPRIRLAPDVSTFGFARGFFGFPEFQERCAWLFQLS